MSDLEKACKDCYEGRLTPAEAETWLWSRYAASGDTEAYGRYVAFQAIRGYLARRGQRA